MLDPLTVSAAVTGATTAYNAIKKAIRVGKEIEDMSSYGVLLLGIQYLNKITNLNELEEFRLNHKVVRPKQNKVTQTTYDQWKLIIDKHFLKNQH